MTNTAVPGAVASRSAGPGPAGPTGIVVLNWNNAGDTVLCLDSLCQLEGALFNLYLVDNASSDDSFEVLSRWCRDRIPQSRLTIVPAGSGAPAGGAAAGGRVVLIQNARNLGYSGGNNVGIRLALADACAYVWVLNNDTVVRADCLRWLVAEAEAGADAGVIGACILEYDQPDIVQCLGGCSFNWLLTSKRPLVAGVRVEELDGRAWPAGQLDYISGASMFFPASTLQRVGLLSEDYFLYYEEVDYAQRCARAGLSLRVALQARVYHKFGSSLGSSFEVAKKSLASAYYGTRGAILVVRRFRPLLLPIVVLARIVRSAQYALRGRRDVALASLRGTLDGLLNRRRQRVTPGSGAQHV